MGKEPGKCLALGQGAACVFHLMRALEWALVAFGNKLAVTITEDMDWGEMIRDINTKIATLQKKTVAETKIRDGYSEASTNLYHIKQAFRHPTAHAVKKKTYDEPEAKDVFGATRSFMSQLAKIL